MQYLRVMGSLNPGFLLIILCSAPSETQVEGKVYIMKAAARAKGPYGGEKIQS